MIRTRYYLPAVLAAGLAVILATQPAPAQAPAGMQPLGLQAACVPLGAAGALVGAEKPKATPLMVDDDGDAWMLLENEANGVSVIGFASPSRGAFCATAIKGAAKMQPGA